MSNFYSEMKYVLESTEETSSSEGSGTSTSSYFPNMYPEALVPVNIRRWPTFGAGSAMASEWEGIGDKITTPLDNLVVTN